MGTELIWGNEKVCRVVVAVCELACCDAPVSLHPPHNHKGQRREPISILLLVLPASHSVAGITYDYDVATQHDGRLLFSKLSTSPPSPPAAPPAPDNTPGAYGVLILDGLFLGLMFGLLQIMMNGGVEVFVRQMRKRNGADEKKRGCCRAMKQSNDEMRDTAAAFGLSTSAARKKKGRAKLVDICECP